MKAKYIGSHTYIGRVGGSRIEARGKTKAEAVKTLRKAFASAGLPTQSDPLVDLLEVSGSGSGFLSPEGTRMTRRERRIRNGKVTEYAST